MATPTSSRATKRSTSAGVSDPPSKLSKVTFLSPTLILLEIPSETNINLPVWEAMRSQHMDVTWTVNPYSIGVQFTPKTSKPGRDPSTDAVLNSMVSSNILQPHMVIQSIMPHHDVDQNTTRVLLTFSQNNTQVLLGQPSNIPFNSEPAASLVLSLPLIITQPPPVHSFTAITPRRGGLSVTQPTTTRSSKAPINSLFHIRGSSDIQICDDFLLNKCTDGKKCKKHHTPYQFHWQLFCALTHVWVDLPPQTQVLMEKLYCDVDQDEVHIKDGNDSYTLRFDTMELDKAYNYEKVRRLTNSDSEEKNPYFPTKWRLFWWNSTNWEEYDKVLSTLLLKKILDKEQVCKFSINSKEYTVDFTTMTQTSAKSGFCRGIRRRPKFYSPVLRQFYHGLGMLAESADDPPRLNFNVNPFEDFTSWNPPVWCPILEEEEVSLVDVPSRTRAYRSIHSLFFQSLPETKLDIISIQQVQNLFQWDRYQRTKLFMQKHHIRSKEPLERHVFHGTTKEAAEDICHNNFDPRLAGVNGVSYGYGSYFAINSSFSNTYTAREGQTVIRHMFLAKVLVGKVIVGQNIFRRPPPLNTRTKHRLYDTCVDNLEKPTMFVVFDSAQCYPYYLIKYKEISKEIVI